MANGTKPLIFFATINAGGGHVATAKAIMQAVEVHYPNKFELELSDLMQDLGQADEKLLRLDQRHKADWQKMLKYPLSIRLVQRVLDSFPRATVYAHRLLLKRFAKLAAEKLNQKDPKLIVANHGWLTVGLTLAQRKYGLRSPVLTFATEPFDASALWADWQAEHFVVPSRPVRKDLINFGVPENKIDIVGYPVQQVFFQMSSQEEARMNLDLANQSTCLVSLGGEGISDKAITIVQSLLKHPLEPQVIVITGRNKDLLQNLQALEHPKLHPRGFVDNMVDYLIACNVVIGKAGPASVMEALTVGRPMLVTSYAGLNELKLCRFLEKEGLGQRINTKQLSSVLTWYLEPKNSLSEPFVKMKQKFADLDFAKMTQHLANYVVSYELKGPPKERSTQRGLA